MAEEAGYQKYRSRPNCGTASVIGTSFCGACGHSLVSPAADHLTPESGATALDPGNVEPAAGSRRTSNRRDKIEITAAGAALTVAGETASAFVLTNNGPSGGKAATANHTALSSSTTTTRAPTTTTAAASTATTPSGPVTLPVVECPTTSGIQGSPPSVYPSSIAVSRST